MLHPICCLHSSPTSLNPQLLTASVPSPKPHHAAPGQHRRGVKCQSLQESLWPHQLCITAACQSTASQRSLPGERPSHHLHCTAGCYALRRVGDNPGAAGDVRPGPPSQAISFCTHIRAEGQGSPLAGEAACNQGSTPLLWPRFITSSLRICC